MVSYKLKIRGNVLNNLHDDIEKDGELKKSIENADFLVLNLYNLWCFILEKIRYHTGYE